MALSRRSASPTRPLRSHPPPPRDTLTHTCAHPSPTSPAPRVGGEGAGSAGPRHAGEGVGRVCSAPLDGVPGGPCPLAALPPPPHTHTHTHAHITRPPCLHPPSGPQPHRGRDCPPAEHSAQRRHYSRHGRRRGAGEGGRLGGPLRLERCAALGRGAGCALPLLPSELPTPRPPRSPNPKPRSIPRPPPSPRSPRRAPTRS